MIDELKTDYKDDVLATSQQGKRTFNIVGKNGEILFEDVHIEDTSRYIQVGDEYGQSIINEQNGAINQLAKGTGYVFDTYAEYLEAYQGGEIPVGAIVYIKEGSVDGTITAIQVKYNDSNVKLALDTVLNKISNTKKYTGLVTSNLVVASNSTGTFTIGSTPFNSLEILYYGWSSCRQSVVIPSGANVNIPLLKSATEMAIVSISSPSNGVVTITNNSSQTITITRIYGINFQ